MSRKITNHEAGYLIMDEVDFQLPMMVAPVEWPVPVRINCDDWMLPCSDQGDDPCCAGEAVNGYAEYVNWRKHLSMKQLPGKVTYDKAKEIDNFPGPGTFLRFALKAAQLLGYIPEDWISQRVDDPQAARYAMHRHGYIVLCGLNVTEGWNHADKDTGAIDESLDEPIGGHAVLYTHYDNEANFDRGPNSWGEGWGDKGFWRMSHEAFQKQYVTGLIITKPGGAV